MSNAWSAYRDPALRRKAAQGATPPPLPLTQPDALERAVWLWRLGLSDRSIQIVMGHYHGHWAPPRTWYGRIHRAEHPR
jgi:hypothetical protein